MGLRAACRLGLSPRGGNGGDLNRFHHLVTPTPGPLLLRQAVKFFLDLMVKGNF